MKPLVILIALLPFSAIAQDLPRYTKPKATSDPAVWAITKSSFSDQVKIGVGYTPLATIIERDRKDAELKMLPHDEVATKLHQDSASMRGGYLQIKVGTTVREGAKPSNFLVIIHAPDGTELRRYQPQEDYKAPSMMLAAGIPVYSCSFIVPLPAAPATDTRVFVVDEISQKRHEYLLRPATY